MKMMGYHFLVLISLLNQFYIQSINGYIIDVIQKRAAPSKSALSQFQNEVLEAHNNYRGQHCVQKLTLDPAISDSAQQYAEELAKNNKMAHDPNTPYGENLYAVGGGSNPITSLKGADATRAWYDEIKDFDFNNGGFNKITGHFTQAVWKDSQKLGVGYALTADGKTAYVVARYDPPGNYEGEYRDNVPKKC